MSKRHFCGIAKKPTLVRAFRPGASQHYRMTTRLLNHIKTHSFIWLLIVLSLVLLCTRLFSDRFAMHDLLVDYTATRNLLAGQQIYHQSYGLEGGLYKYSPFTLFLLVPMAIMPYTFAKLFYFSLTAGLIIFVTIFLERFLTEHIFHEKHALHEQKILLLSVLIIGVHYERELHLGNHNVLLLTLLALSLQLLLHQKYLLPGLLIALVILMKPHFIVVLPLLLLRKKFAALFSALGCIGFGMIFPAIPLGGEKNIELHQAWFATMLDHNSHVDLSRNNTLQAWVYKSGVDSVYPDAGILYNLSIILLIALFFFLFMLQNFAKERQRSSDVSHNTLSTQNFIVEYFLLTALVPSILKTDTEHFLWSLPIILFLLNYLIYRHRIWDMLTFTAITAFFLYGGDWYELWGRDISLWIAQTGLLGLGNFIMLLLVVYTVTRPTSDTLHYEEFEPPTIAVFGNAE